MQDNYIMIGMPGSGKSTLGKILASRIGYDFLDTDDLLIAHYQKPLMHIIEERGVEGFIQAEGEILQTVQVSHTVCRISPSANGVGNLYRSGNWRKCCLQPSGNGISAHHRNRALPQI